MRKPRQGPHRPYGQRGRPKPTRLRNARYAYRDFPAQGEAIMLDLDEAIRMRHSTRMFFRAEEYDARQRTIKAALERLDQLSQECRFWTEVVEGLRAQYQDRLRVTRHIGDSDTGHRELGE